jgi:hypothetical protein
MPVPGANGEMDVTGWRRRAVEPEYILCHSDPAVAGEESRIIFERSSEASRQRYFAALNMTEEEKP